MKRYCSPTHGQAHDAPKPQIPAACHAETVSFQVRTKAGEFPQLRWIPQLRATLSVDLLLKTELH